MIDSPKIDIDVAISSGWNWMSLNVFTDDMSLDNILASLDDSGEFIKSQFGYADYYPGYGWFGNIEEFNNTSMFKLKMVVEDNIEYEAKMNNISETEDKTNKEKIKNEKFIILISDFYYKDSALNLKKDLANKTSLNNIYIKKINDTKYRLLAGPFENFNALKTTYISLNNLGFEDLNIYNE